MPATQTDRLNGLTTSVAVKAPVHAVSSTNLVLAGLQTVDGVALAEGDRVLLFGQTDATENGIYNASTSDWVRAKDFDGNRDAVQGTLVTRQGSGIYQVTSADPLVIGTSAINFAVRTAEQPQIISALDYGVVANSPAAATANYAALIALCAPASSGGTHLFLGTVLLPNPSGADTYYINGFLPFRDGIRIDAQGSTLHFTKTGASAADAQAGFIMAVRDFALENARIEVNYTMSGTTANAGCAMFFGGRGTDTGAGDPFGPIWDSLLDEPMGNIMLRNVHVSSNVAGGTGILMFGGLRNVIFENVWIDGQNALAQGCYYEFGWATSETNRQDRQTSHLHNAHFRNIDIRNLETATTGIGFGLGGAYSALVENLYIKTCKTYISCTPAEALNYRPWVGEDDAGAGKAVTFRNVVGAGATSTAVSLGGAALATGYLSPLALTAPDETDLCDYVLDGFAFLTGGSGHCVRTNAGKIAIKNGTIIGYNRGIVIENETTEYLIENCRIFDSSSNGIQVGLDNNIYATERQSVGAIRHCFVAGSGVGGTSAAISVAFADNLTIENNRLGYEVVHDGKAETTQSQAVTVAVTGFNVVCRNNHVGSTSGGAVAYALAASNLHRGCSISNATGILTRSGVWLDGGNGISDDRGDANVTAVVGVDFPTQRFATTLTANRTVTLSATSAVRGSKFRVVRTGLGAFTLDVGGLKTIASATAAWVDVEHDGTAWRLTGYAAL